MIWIYRNLQSKNILIQKNAEVHDSFIMNFCVFLRILRSFEKFSRKTQHSVNLWNIPHKNVIINIRYFALILTDSRRET